MSLFFTSLSLSSALDLTPLLAGKWFPLLSLPADLEWSKFWRSFTEKLQIRRASFALSLFLESHRLPYFRWPHRTSRLVCAVTATVTFERTLLSLLGGHFLATDLGVVQFSDDLSCSFSFTDLCLYLINYLLIFDSFSLGCYCSVGLFFGCDLRDGCKDSPENYFRRWWCFLRDGCLVEDLLTHFVFMNLCWLLKLGCGAYEKM